MIFYLLRSIRLESFFIHDLSGELMLDTREIVINWLQVSVLFERQPTLRLKNLICV